MSHWSQRQTKQSYQQPNQFFFCITDTEIWTRKVDNCLSMNRDRKCCMLNLHIPSHWLTELFCFWAWKQTNCHGNFNKLFPLSPKNNKKTNKQKPKQKTPHMLLHKTSPRSVFYSGLILQLSENKPVTQILPKLTSFLRLSSHIWWSAAKYNMEHTQTWQVK